MVFDCGHGLLLWFSSTTKKIRSIFVSFFFLVCLKSNQFDFEFFCFCNTEKRKKCLSNNRLIDFIIIRYVDHWKILVLFFFRCYQRIFPLLKFINHVTNNNNNNTNNNNNNTKEFINSISIEKISSTSSMGTSYDNHYYWYNYFGFIFNHHYNSVNKF